MLRFILVVLIACPAVGWSQQDAGMDSGMAISEEYLSKYSTSEGFESLIVNPMLGEGDLETTDGSHKFKAAMTCGSDVPFVSVTLGVEPSGDLNLAEIQVDTNQDGELDQVLRTLPEISGICVNGYISCDLGTWNNCRHYGWDVTESGALSVNSVSIREVGSCHCINDSCAPNYSTLNFDTALSEVGAGISQALAKRDYSLAVTKVDVSGPTITYFGQALSECGEGVVSAQAYFSSPNDMEDAVESTLSSGTPEADIFEIAKNSPSASEAIGSVAYESCSVVREPKLDEVSLFDIISVGAGSASANLINANAVDITIGRIGDNYYRPGGCAFYEQSAELAIFRPDRIVSAELQHVQYDDHMQVILNDNLVWNGPYGNWTDLNGNPPTGGCERETSNDLNSVRVDVLNQFPASPGTLDARLRIAVGGAGEGYARIRVGVDTECKEGQDAIINSCQGYEHSNSCRLKEEVVDGVRTVNEFARTGQTPLPQITSLASPTCEMTVTRDWLHVERVYECKQNNSFDLDGAAERIHKVETTATGSGYTDLRPSEPGGIAVDVQGELSVYDEISVEPCALQCKVRKIRHANDVTVFGLTGEELKENRHTDVAFRSCVNNVCPVEEGEEIVQECGCINGFSDVSIMMQLIRMAGSDMICSSGQKQEL